jgi:thioredoxin reductase (NADPH)
MPDAATVAADFDADADIAIIGAGPVGLFAIFEAGMLDMRCHVFDVLEAEGGQCSALYPEKPIYDIPGHPLINAVDLVEKLRQQAAPFNPVYHLGQQITGLAPRPEGGWRLTSDKGVEITARSVIIAAGCGAFGPNRPPLEGIEAYEGGGGVQYMVRRREDLRGKSVVIAGGGDSAVDWALSLAEVAAKVYVVHRRAKFRAAPESVRQMEALAEAGKIELVVPYQLTGLKGADGKLCGVEAATLDGDVRHLEADVLLAFFGLAMELGPIADWGLDLARKLITVDPATMSTSVPGVFAIGDIVDYPGKLKLILSGFAEAATAVHAARAVVKPNEAYHFEYSTTHGVP